MSVFETINQGTATTPANSWPVEITDGTNILGTPAHPVKVDPTGTTTQPVSGTVTATQPTGTNLHTVVDSGTITVLQPTASSLNATVRNQDGAGNNLTSTGNALDSNLKTVGGAAVQTGTGTSGAGVPRVTVANDSKVQPWDGTNSAKFDATGETTTDITRFGGSPVLIGQTNMAHSIPVVIAADQEITVSAVFNQQSGVVNTGVVPNATGGTLVITNDVFIWSTLVLDLQASGTVSPNGLFQLEASTDGVLWFPLTGTELSDNPGQITTYFTTGFTSSSARYNLACYPYTRVHTTQGFTGTINASMSLTTAQGDEVTFSTTKLVDAGNNPIANLGSEQYTANRGLTPNCYQSASSFVPYVAPSTTSGYWGIQDYYVLPKPSQVGNTMVVVLVSPFEGIITDGTITDSGQNVYTQISPFTTNFSYTGEVSYTAVFTAPITNVDSLSKLSFTIPFGDTGAADTGHSGFSLMVFEYEGVSGIDVTKVAGGPLSSTSPIDTISTGLFNTTTEDAILWLFAAQQLQGSATISSISVDANSAPTITFTAPHPFQVGETVNFAGVTTATWLMTAYLIDDIPFTGHLIPTPAPITAITSTTITLAVNGNCTTPYANTADTGTCTLAAGGPNPAVGYIATSLLTSGQTPNVVFNSTAGTLLQSQTLSSFLTPNGVPAGSSISYIQAYASSALATTGLSNGFSLLNCGGYNALAVAFKAAPTVTITGGVDSTGIVRAASTDINGNQVVVGTGTFATQAAQSGTWNVRTQDGAGNPIASTDDALNVHVLNDPVVQIQDSNGNAITTKSGALNVNVVSGSNAVVATGSAVPAAADYVGLNIAGDLVGQTGFATANAKAAAVAIVDQNGNQIVNMGGAQYSAGASSDVPTGTVAMGLFSATSPDTIKALSVDANGNLNANILNTPSVTAKNLDGSGNPLTSTGGALNVNIANPGGTSGTQYTAATTVPTPTGTVALGWDGTDVRALSTAATGALNVNITGGSSSATQYVGGTAVPTPTGTVALGWDGTDVRTLSTTSAGALNVVGGGGTQYETGFGVPNPIGTLALGWDGTDVRALSTTTTGALDVAITGLCDSVLYVGSAPAGNNNCVPVSSNTYAQAATNPMWTNLTDGGHALSAAVSALGTAPAGNGVMAVNAVVLPSAAAGAALSAKVFGGSTPQATAVNIKASAGNLYGLAITSSTATAGFIQFFNTNLTATTGCVWAIPIAASGSVFIPPSVLALLNFSAGIAINVSTPLNGTTTQIGWTGTIMYM